MSAADSFHAKRIEKFDKIKASQVITDPSPVNIRIGAETIQNINVMGALTKSQKKEIILARVKYDNEQDLPVIKDPDGIKDDSEWRL